MGDLRPEDESSYSDADWGDDDDVLGGELIGRLPMDYRIAGSIREAHVVAECFLLPECRDYFLSLGRMDYFRLLERRA